MHDHAHDVSGVRGQANHRLLAISNRLPELRTPEDPSDARKRSVGGLVSALEPALSARASWATPRPAATINNVLTKCCELRRTRIPPGVIGSTLHESCN